MSEEELIEKLSNYLKDSLGKDLIKALKTTLDKLQKENEQLKEDSISKNKIREVLKDIYFYYGQNNDMFLVDKIRKELLGE